jgi:hypothetical protein
MRQLYLEYNHSCSSSCRVHIFSIRYSTLHVGEATFFSNLYKNIHYKAEEVKNMKNTDFDFIFHITALRGLNICINIL